MLEVDIALVNAFVDGGLGGNPAGVVVDGDRFAPDQRQAIAARAGLSETAFVCRSATADVRLDIYTPTRPIPHCGHATVGAFTLLHAEGRLLAGERVNETVDGPRRIRVAEGRAFLEQVDPVMTEVSTEAEGRLLAALGLTPGDLFSGFRPLVARNGNGTLLVPLGEGEALARMTPDQTALAKLTDAMEVVGAYVFVPQPQGARQAVVRMFAPGYGIPEEAATGMMAGPLGVWLSRELGLPGSAFQIEQGRLMTPPSPSLLEVELDGDRVWVGGRSAVRGLIHVTVP